MTPQSRRHMLPPQIIRTALPVLGMIALGFGYTLLSMGLSERESTTQFQRFGMQTPATLVGYRYITHTHRSPEGDRPVFSYMAKDGIQRTYIAYEYGLATDNKKRALSTQKVQITYLPDNPSVARIEAWNKNSTGIVEILLGASICFMSLVLFYSALKSPNPALGKP